MTTLVLPPRYSRRIFCSCFQAPFVLLYAWHCHLPSFALNGLILFLCSVNYWRHPVRESPRRYVDMFVAACTSLYHNYSALHQLETKSASAVLYWTCVLCSFAVYWRARREKSKDVSSWLHCGTHVCTTASLLTLYTAIGR